MIVITIELILWNDLGQLLECFTAFSEVFPGCLTTIRDFGETRVDHLQSLGSLLRRTLYVLDDETDLLERIKGSR